MLASCDRYFESLLDDEERVRGRRFIASADRVRHSVSHGLLRTLAGHYLGIPARSLAFERGAFGKPHVAEPAHSGLHFNVSHSGDVVLLVFSRIGEVGIDVERWNARLDDAERTRLADALFSETERQTLHSVPPFECERAFYAIWSRKEAYLKGTGAGITGGLAFFDVSLDVGEEGVTAHGSGPAATDAWRLQGIDVGDGYSAALATVSRGALEQWEAHPGLFTGADA